MLSTAFKQSKESATLFVQDLVTNGNGDKRKVVSEIVDYYIDTIQNQQNINVLEKFLKYVASCLSLATKKNSAHMLTFQNEINYLVAICCSRNGHGHSKTEYPEPFDISTIEALVENFGKKRHEELVFLIDDGKVSKDLYRILNIFYYKVRYQERSEVLGILGWLVNLKTLSVGDLNYEEIAGLKIAKNDIVWYLWKMALLLGKIRINCKIVKHYIDLNLALFCTAYTKPKRAKRIEILFHIFYVLSGKNILKYISEKEVEIEVVEIERPQNVNDQDDEPAAPTTDKHIDVSYLKYYTELDSDLMIQVAREKDSIKRSHRSHPVKSHEH